MDKICYTGIGARKNGNHTRKQFLNIMDKKFKLECSKYIKSLLCKSCKKSIKMNTNFAKKSFKYQLKHKVPLKMSKKMETKLLKQINKCNKCKTLNIKPCSFKEYIKYSGAYLGTCEKENLS